MKSQSRDIINTPAVPVNIVQFAERMKDKTAPQWVRDNNRRTLEETKRFLDKVLKTA